MKTGNTWNSSEAVGRGHDASMEPGHEDREYSEESGMRRATISPQWSPVMKTGNTTRPPEFAMAFRWPQWSPVMKTGNTRPHSRQRHPHP